MIGALNGKVLLKKTDALIIMVGGVGYSVFVTATITSKTSTADELLLYTYTHVREDLYQLYGFLHFEELQLFELLLSVSGIGPKTALAVVDRGSQAVLSAIQQSQVSFFTTIPRLGNKNAQKIIIELKSKTAGMEGKNGASVVLDAEELITTLMAMGFSRAESLQAIRELPPETESFKDKIRIALKQLGKKNL